MSCEHCLSRRQFLAAAGVAGFVTLSGCGDGFVSNPPTGAAGGGGGGGGVPSPVIITVASFSGLANIGQLVKVNDSPPLAVKRTGTDTFDAFLMFCTHQGCLIDIVNGHEFDCGCHGSHFANDGSVVQGPANHPLGKPTTSYDPATDQLTIS